MMDRGQMNVHAAMRAIAALLNALAGDQHDTSAPTPPDARARIAQATQRDLQSGRVHP